MIIKAEGFDTKCKHCGIENERVLSTMEVYEVNQPMMVDGKIRLYNEINEHYNKGIKRSESTKTFECVKCAHKEEQIDNLVSFTKNKHDFVSMDDVERIKVKDKYMYGNLHILMAPGFDICLKALGDSYYKKQTHNYITAPTCEVDIDFTANKKYNLSERSGDAHLMVANTIEELRAYKFYKFKAPIVNKYTIPFDNENNYGAGTVCYDLRANVWVCSFSRMIFGAITLKNKDAEFLARELNILKIKPKEFLSMIEGHNKAK